MADKNTTTVFNFGSQTVSGAVFSTSGGTLTLQRYQSTEIMGDPTAEGAYPSQLKVALTEISKPLKAKGERVRYAISSQSVFVRFVSLPPLDEEKVDQIVEFEAQQNVPFPINEVAWNYQLIGDEDDPEVEVALVAIKLDELNDISATVGGVGLGTSGVDIAPAALFNAFRYNYADVTGVTLIIDIGARTTNLIYVEGGKAFIRVIKIGGADITKNIAKEFNVNFIEADQRKAADGFVALGGPYAEHEDPVIAGLSKVIRNSLTRLHSEIVRTTNFFRSQQGGSAPELVLLAGASAGMPFMREFFAEKLSLPIDHFNAFRNVKIAGKVNKEEIQAKSHTMGELVGLALRDAGPCPMEIDLVPDDVREERDVNSRKPALVGAAVILGLLLVAVGFYFQQAANLAKQETKRRESEYQTLKNFNDKIKDQKERIEEMEAKQKPYTQAVIARAYWPEIFRDLNSRMTSDLIWITQLEPLAKGEAITEPVVQRSDDQPVFEDLEQNEESGYVDAILLKGLWRDNDQVGSQVVHQYLDALEKSPYFALEGVDTNQILRTLEVGGGGGRYAWQFEMYLPLPDDENMRIQYTK